jgi:serine/threonine-protein kinase
MLACPRCGSSYSKDQEFCGIDGERIRELDVDPMIGRTIDRYKITGPLGDGGMARVYRARQIYLEQDFAMKLLLGDFASDKNLARRFQREAQAASKIKHPNVVTTIDFGITPEGLIFMAMELLEGKTLTEAIRAEGAMPPARAAYLVRQIAAGLSAAHALGFVHRDLKPKNVMLVGPERQETAKILDFGLVQVTQDPGLVTDATNLTRQGQVFGTPAYMSPEQCAGGVVGPEADIYGLGVILYQLLSGIVPFSGTSAQIAMHHLGTPPPPLSDYDGLGPLAMRMLSKKPADRPSSTEEVIEALDGKILADYPLSGRPVSIRPVAERTVPSRPVTPRAMRFPVELSLIDERSDDVIEDAALGSNNGLWIGAFAALAFIAGLGWYGFGRKHVVAPVEQPVAEQPAQFTEEPPQQPVVQAYPDAAVAKDAEPARVVEEPKPGKRPAVEKPVAVEKPEPEKIEEPEVVIKPPGPEVIDPPADARDFEQRDLSINYRLTNRGLNWRDLTGLASEAAQQWSLWRIGAEQPTEKALEQRGDQLERAIAGLRIDIAFLDAKLERARRILGNVSEDRRDARYTALVDRYNNTRSRVLRAVGEDVLERLASEITLLETDAQLHANSAAEPKTSTITLNFDH